jgi:hypothetical protein
MVELFCGKAMVDEAGELMVVLAKVTPQTGNRELNRKWIDQVLPQRADTIFHF